jgi:diadenosine tetraphosphate (Ap4A) HIT family hydrolase
MDNSNQCIECNFEYNPEAKLLDTQYWRVDLSDNQAYLGRSVVSLNRHAGSLSSITLEEWLELKEVINRFETALKRLFHVTAFNWTALMNDAYKRASPQPHVHFHAWPRYREAPVVNGELFSDPNFAHHYDKTAQHSVSDETLFTIRNKITQALKLQV